jgi:hypothetical protein
VSAALALRVESPSKEATYAMQEVRKGKRLYGWICRFEDGRVAYMARRKHSEVYRGGHSTISDAIRAGVAAWALDDETLLAMRAKGIPYVGVMVEDTGDRYITRIAKFFEKDPARKVWKFHDYSTRGGSPQRLLPLSEFAFRAGEIAL